jgi:hypothetical protein
MKTLRSMLSEHNIVFPLYCYEEENYYSLWEARTIIENQDLFSKVIVMFPIEVLSNFEDYYRYLFYMRIASLSQVRSHLCLENERCILDTISKAADMEIRRIQDGDLVRFINGHAEEIFRENTGSIDLLLDDIDNITFDIIAKYSSRGINKEVLLFVIKHYRFAVIDRFEQFEKMLEKTPDLIEQLFPTGHLETIERCRFRETLEIWAHIMLKNKSNLKCYIGTRIDELFDDIVGSEKDGKINNIFQSEILFKDFYSFLLKIKNPKAYAFESIYNRVRSMAYQTLETVGVPLELQYPINMLFEKWKEGKRWEHRLHSLTHFYVNQNGEPIIVSYLSIHPDRPYIEDFAENWIKKDAYYTVKHQNALRNKVSERASLMEMILCDASTREDYCGSIASAILFVEEKIGMAEGSLQLDFKMLISMLGFVIGNRDANDERIQPLSYGAAMFLCAFTEKLMRGFYQFLLRDKVYIPPWKLTLNLMLSNDEDNCLVKVFGEDHLRNLAFFFVQSQETKIGENIRNALAHWQDVVPNDMSPVLVDVLLWLFTDVLNTIELYLLKQMIED